MPYSSQYSCWIKKKHVSNIIESVNPHLSTPKAKIFLLQWGIEMKRFYCDLLSEDQQEMATVI